MIKRVSFAAARRSRLTPRVAVAAVVAGAVVGGAEGVIHFNVLVVLIVGAVGATGAGVGGVAAANRPRGISQVPGTVPAGPAGGAGSHCRAGPDQPWNVSTLDASTDSLAEALLLTGVLIVLIAVAGSLPARPAGQRIISFALGLPGPCWPGWPSTARSASTTGSETCG